MPKYDYKCKDCEEAFFLELDINIVKESVFCFHCQSFNVHRVYKQNIIKNRSNNSNQELKYSNTNKKSEAHIHDHCSPELEYI